MKKLLLFLIVALFAFQGYSQTIVWKGITWDVQYGTAIVDVSGNLVITADASGYAWVHVNQIASLTGVATPWIQLSYMDVTTPGHNIDMLMENELGFYPRFACGSMWSGGEIMALRTQSAPTHETYLFFDDTRQDIERTVYVGKRATGTLDVNFDGKKRSSTYLNQIAGGSWDYSDVYLRLRGAAPGETVTFTDFTYGINHINQSPTEFLVWQDDQGTVMSIQTAIDEAAPTGDVINVAAGTHTENLNITKQLDIRGANYGINPNDASWNPNPSRVAESIIEGTIVGSPNGFSLDGFTLKANSGTTIVSIGGTAIGPYLFQNNIFLGEGIATSAFYDGIANSTCSFVDNKFTGFTAGSVAIVYVDGSNLDGLLFSGNLFVDNSRWGIHVGDEPGSKTITGNKFDQSATAMIVPNTDWTITNNIITNSGGGIYFLQTVTTGTNIITNNTFTNTSYALNLSGSDGSISFNNNNLLGGYTSGANIGKCIFNTTSGLDATCNYYGTILASEIAAKISGPVTYIPYEISDGGPCTGGLPIITNIETPTSTVCGSYDLDVTVQDFVDVGAISLVLDFDPSIVGTPIVTNLTTGLTANFPSAGQLRVAYWGTPITLADDAVLFTLHFDLLPAISGVTSNFTWSTVPNDCEYAGPNGDPVYNSTFNDFAWIIPVRPVKNTTTLKEYCSIKAGIADALSGEGLLVAAVTLVENGQIVIDKNLTITGAGIASTIVKTDQNTGSSGDPRGWWLVNDGIIFHLGQLTLDGTGFDIYQGIRHKGTGTIDLVELKNMVHPGYSGVGVAAFGGPTAMNVHITNSTFANMGRIGVLYFGTGITGSNFHNNTYTGKGPLDCLDYMCDIGAGAVVDIQDCTVSNNKGVASSDGSTSAGILVTTYYGAGSTATISGCDITANTTGIAVGYDNADGSVVTANNNNIYGNVSHGVSSTVQIVDAKYNWWGDASGPSGVAYGSGDAVSDYVDYCPWLDGLYPGGVITANVINITAIPNTVHCSIQDGIDNASTGDVITVASGVYNENLIVHTGVTLLGANAGIPCYMPRGDESSIVGSTTIAISVNADGVTIDGFTIANPSGNHAIYATGRNNLSVKNNIIQHIGTLPVLSGNSHAIAIAMSSAANINNINISENCFSDILGGEDPALSGALAKANNGSASAIAVGWSNANFDISNLNIENNFISNVNACTNIWEEGGKGAYGVIINVGASGSFAGKAVSPIVHYNTISDLEGLWAHGVGLEGETPGAVVNNNEIFDLTDHKTPSDATGILLEQNDGAGTVGLHDNSLTNMGMRIVNLMPGKVDATCNWYGMTDPTTISTLIYGNMNVNPYLVSGVNTTAPGLPGFIPTASCTGYFPIHNITKNTWFVSIQAAIDDAVTADGDVIQVEVADFTEPGFVLITKAVTIQGYGKTSTTVRCNVNTASGGHGNDAAIWFSGSAGKFITIQNMTLDATGKDVAYGVTFRNSGEVNGVAFNQFKHSASQYYGIAVQVLDGNVDVEGCTFTEIGRIGTHYRNGVITGAVISGTYDNNEYTGKGAGDWLDYALDISGGTTVVVSNSTVTNNLGVALSDGSTSAGVLVTSYYPTILNMPNDVTIVNNFLNGNTTGVAVGYSPTDVSVAVINNNDLSGNTTYGVNSTNPTVDATCNWWGFICGSDIATYVNGPVSFTSWLIGNTDGAGAGFQPLDPCTGVFPELTSVSMQASKLTVGPAWDYLVSGDLGSGYSMCITPDIGSFYLDIDALTSSPGLLVDFLNPFTLDQTSLPTTWLTYWAGNGVDGGGPYGDWRDQMWEIINGNAPFFYIKLTTGSDYILVDGLQYWLYGGEPILELPGDYPNHVYTYTGDITDVDDCVSLPIAVTMDFHTCDISGTLAYNNSAQTGLNNMTVTLNSTPAVSATTGTDGSYTLSNVQSGTHTVTFSDNGLTAGGINATDAAQANYWGTTSWSIEKVRFFAGDVNNDNNVLALDAQQILAYFVNAGNTPYNFTPIWKFWLAGDMINANPYAGPANPSVTILSTSETEDLYGLCTGDFNQSFTPGLTKSASESLLLDDGKNIYAAVGTELELPIAAGMDMDLGAVSLIMNFPADKLEITEVFLSSDPSSSLIYNISGDELRIGWNSLIPLYLNEGESLISLKVKVIDESGVEGISLSLVADLLNELANGEFFVIEDAILIADVIHTSALGITNYSGDELTLANHPNPFKGTTNFVYTLPVEGRVILDIYDLVGNKVMTVVDATQSAGEYTYKLQTNRLQPGVYTAHLRLSNADSKLVQTIKILSR